MHKLSNDNLKTKRVFLRPVQPDDYGIIYEMHTKLDNLHLWWNDRHILDFDSFVDDFRGRLRSYAGTFFLTDKIEDGNKITIGLVYAYKINHIDKHSCICIYLLPEHTAKGFGAEAGVLFCNYLFQTYGFRKIYAEILGYNLQSLKIAQQSGFNEEAILKDYYWYNDRYWDFHIYSITHQEFMPLKKRLVYL
jgi:RimJ/RimL family protein N-acetyltransferase